MDLSSFNSKFFNISEILYTQMLFLYNFCMFLSQYTWSADEV